MKTGIELIADERQEQIEKHGRTVAKDVINNRSGQLIMATIGLIKFRTQANWKDMPAKWNDEICKRMAKKSYKERLVIAGALIAAEIDRIQAIEFKSE